LGSWQYAEDQNPESQFEWAGLQPTRKNLKPMAVLSRRGNLSHIFEDIGFTPELELPNEN
jgi:hypothetical protein